MQAGSPTFPTAFYTNFWLVDDGRIAEADKEYDLWTGALLKTYPVSNLAVAGGRRIWFDDFRDVMFGDL